MADDYVVVFACWMHFSAATILFGSLLCPSAWVTAGAELAGSRASP
jgi:hypothetical protein